MFMRVFVFLAILLGGGFLFFMSQRPGGLGKAGGISEIVSKVPKETGFLLVMDVRHGTDLKKDLQLMREKFKDTPQVLKAVADAESEMGVKFDELADWVKPAGFLGVLPAPGHPHLWSSAAKEVAASDSKGELIACKSNLKNMATACEMYSTDWAGRYPDEAQLLIQGNYLRALPTCPSSADQAYTYEKATEPDLYTLTCRGSHGDTPSPSYNSMMGLVSVEETAAAAPAEEQPPLVYFGMPVGDEKLAKAHLEKLIARGQVKPKVQTVGGSSFWVEEEAYFGLHHGYLLGASSKAGLEALLASFDGKAANLTAHPVYAAMRKKVPEEQGVVAFLPLQGLAETLDSLPADSWDEKTKENLQAFQFLAGSASMTKNNLRSSMVLGLIANDKADFVKALLTPPSGPMVTASFIPAEWNYYSAIDLAYLYHAVVEGMRMSPSSRTQVDEGLKQIQAGSGIDIEKDLLAAFSGEVGWSGNYIQKMPTLLAGNFGRARAQGQLTACKSNLKNIATANEMWSADNSGRYPSKLSQLTPEYLRTIPTCPDAGKDTYSESFVSTQNPDDFTVVCAGHNHGSAGDFPQYNGMVGLIEGDAQQAPPAADPGLPTTVLALGVKDAAKAEELIKKIDAMIPFSPGAKVGEAQILVASAGPQPVARVLVTKPATVLLVAFGPDSETMLKECLEAKNPVSKTAEFQKVQNDQPERWVNQSYVNLKSLLTGLSGLMALAPDSDEKKLGGMLIGELKESSGVSYTVVEKDCVRMVSDGNAAIATGGTAVVAAVLVPNFVKARSQGQLTACKSNQKNLATALEMYASDNSGAYPQDLKPIVSGQYLRSIPTCPAAQADTYSPTYEVATQPDMFSFYCRGEHHRGAGTPADYPRYNAEQGLIERP